MAVGDIVDLDEILEGYTPMVDPQFSPEVSRAAVKDLNFFDRPSQEEIARDLYGITAESAPSATLGSTLLSTTFGDIAAQRALGPFYNLLNKDSPPVDIVKDANFLPKDQFERGQKALLLEYYQDSSLRELDPRIDPTTNRMTYIRPEDGKRIYVNAPGVDLADFKTSFIEPLALDLAGAIGGGALGLQAEARGKIGKYASGAIGALFGSSAAEGLGLGTVGQAGVGTAGAAVGYASPTLALSAEGAFLTHMLWRKANLEGFRERGILDETYTDEKILRTAVQDASIIAGAELVGGTLFASLGKLLGASPASVGISREQFDNALDTVKTMRKEASTPQEKELLDNLTVPEVLEVAGVDAPFKIPYMKAGIERLGQSPQLNSNAVYREILEEQTRRTKAMGDFFESTGIDPAIFKPVDATKAKQGFGESMLSYADDKVLPNAKPNQKALMNVFKNNKGEPEMIFGKIWKPQSVSLNQALIGKLTRKGDEASKDVFKSLIYKDFLQNTVDGNGQFVSGQVDKYLRQYSDSLGVWFGDDMVKGLQSYNTLLKKIDTGAVKVPEGAVNSVKKMVNDLVRAYVGIFTREGRVVTALTRGADRAKLGNYEKLILDPDLLAEKISRRDFFDDPGNRMAFRYISRGFGQDGFITPDDKIIYGETPLAEEQDRVNLEVLDSILAEFE
tara:strand:- start:970 stop:3003 length:2034 start_codon:yes stop_codon:yes gene_type:complete